MLKIILLITGLTISPFLFSSDQYYGKDYCEIKKQRILTQLEYARQYGNSHRAMGLNRALSNIENHCKSSGDYHGDYSYSFDKKISDKKRKVAKRKAELDEARAIGRPDKIAKKVRKLAEAQYELDEVLARQSFE